MLTLHPAALADQDQQRPVLATAAAPSRSTAQSVALASGCGPAPAATAHTGFADGAKGDY